MLVGSFGVVCSRFTGLLRDMVFARFWGTGSALGGFILAFTIPNLFRRLFGEGALTAAFVPVFNDRLSEKGKGAAFLLLSQVLSVVAVLLAAICGVGIAVSILLLDTLPGPLAQLSVKLLPILLPYLIFICLAGFLAGVLNSFEHFAIPAFAPLILNLALIGATIWLCPRLGESAEARVTGLAWAVLVAGALQLVVLFPILWRFGYRFRFLPQFRSENVREVGRLVLPGLVGAGIYQLNVLCDRVLAGWLGAWAVTSLYYSERLVYLPIGVFAVALSAACLPVMSRACARNQPDDMLDALFYSLRHILFLSLPCVLGLMLLGDMVINLIFRHGAFGDDSFRATLGALLFYAPGIPLFAALKIIRSGFYSRKNTSTPMKVSAGCLALNLALNLILMGPMQQRGLALATSISAGVNCLLLLLLLYRELRPDKARLRRFGAAVGKQLLALGGAGLAMYFLRLPLAVKPPLLKMMLEFLLPATGGMLVYFSLALILRSAELKELLGALRRRRA